MKRIVFTALAALALFPASTPAQGSYRLTLKELNKGDKALYRKVTRFRMEATFANGKEKAVPEQKNQKSQAFVFLQEVLEKPADASKGLKLRRAYRRAERTTEDGVKHSLSYEGKELVIEKQDGRYKFRTKDGTELSGDPAKELNEEFNSQAPQMPPFGAAWLPKAAVKVGEPWTIDPALFVKHLGTLEGARLETGRATAVGKLLRTYRKDGRQYGVLDVQVEIAIPGVVADKVTVKLKDSKLTFRMVADGCIDGSDFAYRLKGVMEWNLDGVLADGGKSITIRGRIQGDYFESRQEIAKE